MLVQKPFFQAMTTEYKDYLFIKTGLKRVLLWSWFKMPGLCSKDQYCGTLDLEEQLMERSRTGKACVLALALG